MADKDKPQQLDLLPKKLTFKQCGAEYPALIAEYLTRNYGHHDIEIHREVRLGSSIIGKRRKVDLLLIERASGKPLALECKFQGRGGTTDEKIYYAVSDIQAMRIPGCVVYAGAGFSKGVLQMLAGSGFAAYCLPHPVQLQSISVGRNMGSFSTWELDHLLAMTFSWWDILREEAPDSEPPGPKPGWPNIIRLESYFLSGERKPPKRAPPRGPPRPSRRVAARGDPDRSE